MHAEVGARVHRLWTERLLQEYEAILYCHRLKLRRPVIAIRPLEGKWGLWDPETRTLSLSTALLETQEWPVVVQILKHEMAHQLVTDTYGADDAHGPRFQEACDRLGVEAWAARASGDLPGESRPWKAAKLDDPEERLLQRVEKLLALATSSNEHEAAAAMGKVQELYAKHNLDRLARRLSSEHVAVTIHHRSKRVPRHQAMIGSLLNDFFFVRIIYTTVYDAPTTSEFKAMELLGTRENVAMAEYVYWFLWNQLARLWTSYRKETRRMGLRTAGARSRNSFLIGVLTGFRDRLESQCREGRSVYTGTEARSSRGVALVRLEDPSLESFVRFRFPRLVNVQRRGTAYDADSYSAGRDEGKKLVLHRPIASEAGNRGRLLTR